MKARKPVGIVIVLLSCHWAVAQPLIRTQPTNMTVSLAGNAQFSVKATSTNPPITYQWWFKDTAVDAVANPSAATNLLSLTNVTLANGGPYFVVVSDKSGSATSQVATLVVDLLFTRIASGPLVTDKAHWHGAAWGDYDNDGDLDLFVIQAMDADRKNILYRNDGDGTFTKIIEPTLQNLVAANGGWTVSWGDFDNDGYLDLFITSGSGAKNALLRNRGDGTFQSIISGPGAEGSISDGGTWGDWDQDGDLDLFVTNSDLGRTAALNWLYLNQGNGAFVRATTNEVGCVASDRAMGNFGTCVDFDGDGLQDLFVSNLGGKSFLYRNPGGGRFDLRATNELVSESLPAMAFAWADYDNDGDLDVFVGMFDTSMPNRLYRNEGAGHFKNMSASEVGPPVQDRGHCGGVAWGDYDNDGFLDLFVANGLLNYVEKSFLYHNNGDGTFTRILDSTVAVDTGVAMGGYWVDYDQDGSLDLFVQEHGGDTAPRGSHRLYRNNGNTNSWLTVNCIGTRSARWGTGVKVRVQAVIRGKSLTQLRLIDAGATPWGGQSFEAHFGLGNATNVEVVRIEWPSGIVQELRDVAAKQRLTVTEPIRLQATGLGQFQFKSWKGQAFTIKASADLTAWNSIATVTNLTGTVEFTDPEAGLSEQRFYRVVTCYELF
jgi:hypothetical protein